MDIYLVKKQKEKGPNFRLETAVESETGGNGLVNRIKEYYHKFEKPNTRALKYACKNLNKEEINVFYSSKLSEEEAKQIYEAIINKEVDQRKVTMPLNVVLVAITFIIAPFLPVLNWGFTAYFAYRTVVDYRIVKKGKYVLKKSKLVKSDSLEEKLNK